MVKLSETKAEWHTVDVQLPNLVLLTKELKGILTMVVAERPRRSLTIFKMLLESSLA